jgi:hypothetical protein
MDLMLRFRKDAASNVEDTECSAWELEHPDYGQSRWLYDDDGMVMPLEDANSALKLYMAVVVDQRKHSRPKNHAKHARLKMKRLHKQKQKLEAEVKEHTDLTNPIGLGAAPVAGRAAAAAGGSGGSAGSVILDSRDDSKIEHKRKQLRRQAEDREEEESQRDSFWGAIKSNHSYVGPFLSYHPVYTRFERATILFAACVQTMFTSVLWYGNSNPDNIFEQAIIIGASAFIQGPITVLLLIVFGLDMQIAEKKMSDHFGDDEDGENHDLHLERMLHGHKDSHVHLPQIGATLGYIITFFSAAVALYATNLFVVPMSDGKALRWLNSQWCVNLICIIVVEPLRCWLTWKLGKVSSGPACMKCLVATGCCCCCLESEEAIQKRAQDQTKTMRDKFKAKMKLGSLSKRMKVKKRTSLVLAGLPVDEVGAKPIPDNLPEVLLIDHDDAWPTIKMWV